MAGGTFDLSARITGDASGLVAAASQGEAAIKEVGGASQQAAAGAATLEKSTGSAAAAMTKASRSADQQAASTARIAQATAQLDIAQTRNVAATTNLAIAHDRAAKAADNDASAQLRIAASLARAEGQVLSSSLAVARAQEKLGAAQGGLTTAFDTGTKAANRQQYAVRNVGQQFGDFGLQVAGGTSVARAFGQQAGQLGFALSEMGGKLGKVGAFLTGPWGIALTIAAAFVAPLVEKLFEAGKAADEQASKLAMAATAADSYGTAQSLLGKVIDLTTGKLKTQNSVLIETIKLQAQANILKAQADQKTAAEKLTAFGNSTATERASVNVAAIGSTTAGSGNVAGYNSAAQGLADKLAPVSSAVRDYVALTSIANASQDSLSKGLDATLRRIDALSRSGKLAGRDAIDAKAAVLALGTTLNDQRANKQVLDALNGKGIAGDLKTPSRGASPKPSPATASPSTVARDEFGRDAADRIENITAQYNDTPQVVQKVNRELRTLDDLIDDLNRKKPPGFAKLIEDATAAKDIVKNGLQKPYQDYLDQQAEGLAVQRLVAAGRLDEADALKITQGLQKQMVPLTAEQRDNVLATVQNMREQARQIDILREKNAKYLEALGSIKGVVEDATQAFVRGDLGQFIKSPKKLLDAFQTLQGRAVFDKLFGGMFRDLEDQINGTSAIKKSADEIAVQVDRVSAQTDKTTAALDKLAGAANRAAGGVSGGSLSSSSSPLPGGVTVDPDGTIAVAGSSVARKVERDPTKIFQEGIGGVATKIASVFTNPESAAKIGANIGKFAGKGLEGAATGSVVNGFLAPIGKALGFKTSQTGAQIGGAAGAFLPIPFGKEVGAVVGSVIGGLFKSNNKYGSSSLNITDGVASAGTSIGKGSAEKNTASALGGSLASGLNSVAQALGATLGSANVSIGYRPGHKAPAYRVDPTGRGAVKDGSVKAFETEEEAVAFAIRDAILDGAVTGLSAAMQKALSANEDIDKAVQEALGVKALESALNGVTGSLKAQFAAEDAAAKERLRLARSYGVDIVATEKLNAEQRVALVDQALTSRIGSLSATLESLKFGDLFEGSAVDRLEALQVEIDKAEKAAAAGTAGASDTLANLLQQKVGVARDAYGTAGTEFSGARSDAISTIDKIIQMETERVNSAAGITTAATAATTAAVLAGNGLADEQNGLIAKQNTILENLPSQIAARLSYGGNDTPDYSSTGRYALNNLAAAY